jgi:hypothetical protein
MLQTAGSPAIHNQQFIIYAGGETCAHYKPYKRETAAPVIDKTRATTTKPVSSQQKTLF